MMVDRPRRALLLGASALVLMIVLIALPVGLAWRSHSDDSSARDVLAQDLQQAGVRLVAGSAGSGVSSIPYGSSDCGVWASAVLSDTPATRERLGTLSELAVQPLPAEGRLRVGLSMPSSSGWKALLDPRCWRRLPDFIDRHERP
jgi:hypothetical protein